MSEKNHSLVTIKTLHGDKPIVGAVQKVLNQIIILKSTAAQPITLTFGDIESVDGSASPIFTRFLQILQKTLHRHLRFD